MGTAQLLQAGGLIAVAGFSIAIVKVLWGLVKELRTEIDTIQNARIEELKDTIQVLQDNERIYLSLTERQRREREEKQ